MSVAVIDQVGELLAGWVPAQRWFGGKGRAHTLTVQRLAELGPLPQLTLWTVQVAYVDGGAETYQVPLVARAEPVPFLEHALLGSVETETGRRYVYDAPHDAEATRTWLLGVQAGTAAGPVQFARYVEADRVPVDERSLVLSGEQSNTSMVFGDVAIMKLFRRLQPGVNPDIELVSALSEHGAANVAALFGSFWLAGTTGSEEPVSLGFVQEFLSNATDGWQLATTSVRDLMAEADLHADEAGGDFAGEAQRLGEAVAAVHADLAAIFGVQAADPGWLRRRVGAMRERLAEAAVVVPQLAAMTPALEALYGQAAQTTAVPTQRIHGDLHLGQTLRAVDRWVLIDFEGEPMASIADRRAPDSPLRDVAGMLRSFDYAGRHRVVDGVADAQLEYRAAEWAARNRAAFLAGYATAVPDGLAGQDALLRAYEADKAVYEAVYEARNRPAWLAIPLASLTRLASGGTP